VNELSRQTSGELSVEVAGRAPWFHNLHLPDGTQTAPDHPLGDFPMYKGVVAQMVTEAGCW